TLGRAAGTRAQAARAARRPLRGRRVAATIPSATASGASGGFWVEATARAPVAGTKRAPIAQVMATVTSANVKTSGWGQTQNQAGGPTTPRIAHHAATRRSSHGASHTNQATTARNSAFATCGAES